MIILSYFDKSSSKSKRSISHSFSNSYEPKIMTNNFADWLDLSFESRSTDSVDILSEFDNVRVVVHCEHVVKVGDQEFDSKET